MGIKSHFISSHFSLRSCLDLNELFKSMFSDSEIAAKFIWSKTKCGYYINFDLAPYFQDRLVKKSKESQYYALQFDE